MGLVSGASKYAPLARLLTTRGADVVEMTFAEVDRVVPGGLPESACRYRTWWTVSVGNSAQSRHGWTCAGYQVSQVDLVKHLVTFAKAATAMRQVAAPQARPRSPARAGPGSLSLPVDRR